MFGEWRVWLLINTLQTPLFACYKHIRWCRKKTIKLVVNTLYKKIKNDKSAKIRAWMHSKIDKGPKNTDQICCFNPFWRNVLFILSSGTVFGDSICSTFSKYIKYSCSNQKARIQVRCFTSFYFLQISSNLCLS